MCDKTLHLRLSESALRLDDYIAEQQQILQCHITMSLNDVCIYIYM